jgi:hypothetical protein
MNSNDNFHEACIDLGKQMERNAKILSEMVIRSKNNNIEDQKPESIDSRFEILDL